MNAISMLMAAARAIVPAPVESDTPIGEEDRAVGHNLKQPRIGSAYWNQAMDQEEHSEQLAAYTMSLADVG
jgi:hypothetical protein